MSFLPIFPVDNDEKPEDLVDECDNEQWEEDEPENEKDSFVENVDWQDAQPIVVHHRSTGAKELESALGHLWEDCGERAWAQLLLIAPKIHQEVGTIAEEPALQVPIHPEDVEENVDEVQKVGED